MIGKGIGKSENLSIRNGLIKWIEYQEADPPLSQLHSIFCEIMESINSYFRLSLKRFESQFSIYEKDGFYKLHLDQHKNSRHRQITCCLYLNDCTEGGELVLYKKGSKETVDVSIRPLKGSLVLFASADIYHEVKHVQKQRLSITTWFRDDIFIL